MGQQESVGSFRKKEGPELRGRLREAVVKVREVACKVIDGAGGGIHLGLGK